MLPDKKAKNKKANAVNDSFCASYRAPKMGADVEYNSRIYDSSDALDFSRRAASEQTMETLIHHPGWSLT